MQHTRLWLASGFVMLLGLGFVVSRGDAQPNTVKKIAEGVWFREGDIAKLGHCNNIIIEMKDHLIVVDANFPSGARLALEDAKKVSSKPVKYVFDTHHHGDHAYGNAGWTTFGFHRQRVRAADEAIAGWQWVNGPEEYNQTGF